MNIDNNIKMNSTPTFQARRVLSLDKLAKNMPPKSVDVFQLSESDIDFAKNCVEVLSGRKELNKFQKSLKNFFKMFVNEYSEIGSNSFYRSQNYYLSIKDGETISGLTHSFQLDDVMSLNGGALMDATKMNKDGLLYAVLNGTKSSKCEELSGAGTLGKVFKLDSEFLNKKEYMKLAREIKKSNPDTTFDTKPVENVDLAKFLDIEF